MLAGLVILAGATLLAVLLRWLLNRVFKGIALDRFLQQSGLTAMLGRSGTVRARRLVSGAVFWMVLATGVLTALSAFNSQITSRMIENLVFLFPKLLAAGAILLAGLWAGQYAGRTVLVWACNEDIASPRALAAGVRAGIAFVAVVVAADYLNFARSVFLAAFVIAAGGAVLAAALALGLGGRDVVRRRLEHHDTERDSERSLWNHL